MGFARYTIERDGLAMGPEALAHDIKGLRCPRKGRKRSKKAHSHVCLQAQRYIRHAWTAGWSRSYKYFLPEFERGD